MPRPAIITKYLGPTNTRGSRVRASCAAGSTIVSWDHRYDSVRNHAIAAECLCSKLGWPTHGLRQGALGGGRYVFVMD